MRRIPRADKSIDLLRRATISKSKIPYLCSVCEHQATFSTSSSFQDRKRPYAERLRQKIWGTSQPPGLEDPYGGPEKPGQTKKKPQKLETNQTRESRPHRKPYVPATTWDGLEELGLPEPRPIAFNSFVPAEVMTDEEEITTAFHRAMVEVFTLKDVGRPLSQISVNPPAVDETYSVQIYPSSISASGAQLQYSSTTQHQILESLAPAMPETATQGSATTPESSEDVLTERLAEEESGSDFVVTDETLVKAAPTESEEDVAADRSSVDPLDAKPMTYHDVITSWDPNWLLVSLNDPEIMFAVLKRTMQLTGIRLNDSTIRGVNTAEELLRLFITPPKPTKLVETLVQQADLMNLPNVSVYGQRVTQIDKEMQVGRWKLIQEELQKRGLPLTHRG